MSKKLILDLRNLTGAGFSTCKEALDAVGNNLDEAVVWLRKNGASVAAKKMGREASEGVIGLLSQDTYAVMAEVNCETDFLARNERFHSYVYKILNAGLTHKCEDLESLSKSVCAEGQTVENTCVEAISFLKENIVLRRWAMLKAPKVYGYVHNALNADMGCIGVLVGVSEDMPESLARDIAMHIAAFDPKSLSRDDLDSALIEKEKEILLDQMKDLDKPAAVKEKMLDGRLKKFFADSVLLEQGFVRDPKQSVAEVIKSSQGTLLSFKRFLVGEKI